MSQLTDLPDIGDQINKKIIAPIATSNRQLSQADFPDFNDSVNLSDGKERRSGPHQGYPITHKVVIIGGIGCGAPCAAKTIFVPRLSPRR